MANITYGESFTVASGATETFEVVEAQKRASGPKSFLIDATGSGTLAILTQALGKTAYNTATSISGESVNLDFAGLQRIRFTASVDSVDITVSPND